jgi:galactonate dehydratase
MKIKDVEVIFCSAGEILGDDLLKPIPGSGFEPRNWTFAKITTDTGLVGWGEGTDYPGEDVIGFAAKELARFIVGEDPLNIERLWERMYAAAYGGTGKIYNCAISMIDHALWDIAGKAFGAPVYNLLGGRCRDRIRLYGHIFLYNPTMGDGTYKKELEPWEDRAKQLKRDGYTALKMFGPMAAARINRTITNKELRETVDAVKKVRDIVGDDIDICMDINGRLDVLSAIKLCRALEPFNMLFVEDPVRQDIGAEAMRRVKMSTKTPICTGENLYNVWGFQEYFDKNAVDIIMPDLCHCGGITQGKKIASMAWTYLAQFAPHNPNGPISSLVSAHVCASIPNFLVLEFVHPDVPYRDRIMTNPLKVKDGYLELPATPGLGADLIEKEIEKHPFRKMAFYGTYP